jgi:hypothetical protein
MKVYKYTLDTPNDYVEVPMPVGATILSVQVQYDVPCIWALVNPDNPMKIRRFRWAGTGHNIQEPPEKLSYIGTFQMMKGSLIFHIFEIVE